jgi:AmiR/NasT family two-component response regulator
MEKALASSSQIDMAIGILMGIDKLTEDEAFSLLRIASQGHRKLHNIALDVITPAPLHLPNLNDEPRQRSS